MGSHIIPTYMDFSFLRAHTMFTFGRLILMVISVIQFIKPLRYLAREARLAAVLLMQRFQWLLILLTQAMCLSRIRQPQPEMRVICGILAMALFPLCNIQHISMPPPDNMWFA